MTSKQIKNLALRAGFKLKEQADGTMDLNPYVYEFANALLNRWISVDDELPTVAGRYLCYRPSDQKQVVEPLAQDTANDKKFLVRVLGVSHWQPLPQPPKE